MNKTKLNRDASAAANTGVMTCSFVTLFATTFVDLARPQCSADSEPIERVLALGKPSGRENRRSFESFLTACFHCVGEDERVAPVGPREPARLGRLAYFWQMWQQSLKTTDRRIVDVRVTELPSNVEARCLPEARWVTAHGGAILKTTPVSG